MGRDHGHPYILSTTVLSDQHLNGELVFELITVMSSHERYIQAAIITTLVYAYQGEMAKKQFLWGATGHNCKGRSMVELDDYSIPMPAELVLL